MRVLHIAEGSRYAGIESHLLTLFAELRRHGVDVALALFDRGPLFARAQAARVTVTHLHRRHKYDRTAIRQLAELVGRSRPDLIHTHGYLANIVAARALAARRTPLVTTVHGAPEPFRGFAGVKMRVNLWLDHRTMRRHCHRVIAVAGRLAEGLAAAGVPREKIAVVHNGLPDLGPPVLNRAAARAGYDLPEGAPTVAFVGRLEPVKEPAAFVEFAAAVRREVPDAAFLIAGDGPLFAAMRTEVVRHDLEGAFHFLGFVDDLAPVYLATDLLALTSRHEGIPNVALEAMRAGKPVVAPAVGGLPELLEGLEGVLAPPADPAALARLAVPLLTDAARREAAGAAARDRFLARFTAAHMVAELLQVYRDVLGESR